MGSILVEEEPFAYAVTDRCHQTHCSWCFKTQKDMKRCSRCRFLSYCSKECQRMDFAVHKKECNYLARAASRNHHIGDEMRLVGRVILKLQSNPAPAFNGRTFASLNKTFDFDEIPDLFSPDEEDLRNLRDFMCEDGLPPVPELVEIWTKTLANLRLIANHRTLRVGYAIYLGISELRHSCDPDVYCLYSGNKAVIRALKPGITSYSQDLRDCYTDPMTPNSYRQNTLNRMSRRCDCSVCKDEKRAGVESSLRCAFCANGYCLFDKDEKNLKTVPRCALCDRTTTIDISDAREVINEMEKRSLVMQGRFAGFYCGRLFALSDFDLYMKGTKILSVYNLYFYQFAWQLRKRLPVSGFSFVDIACLADHMLACKKFYLSERSPLLSHQYQETGMLQFPTRNFRYVKELEEKAIELLLETHGEDSVLIKDARAGVALCDELMTKHRHQDEKVISSMILTFLQSQK